MDPRSAEALREHDEVGEPASSGGMKAAGGLAGWLDDRTGGAGFMSYLLKKTFPDHWTFMLGEIAMYSLIICLLTGTFLTFWFVPSAGQVVYDGSYLPLQGITMSEAYQSTVDISFDVRGGPADPPDPPLGGAAVHRRDHRAHVPRVLHRRVPQAA